MSRTTSLYRKLKRWSRRKKNMRVILALVVAFVFVVFYSLYMNNRTRNVDVASIRPLLELVARAESNHNYNAYFGNASNKEVQFTQMPIKEVKKWQANYIKQGSQSSAVGKYQIIDSTLSDLVDTLEVSDEQIFDEAMQDKMAVALIERRGANQYVSGELSAKEFAANLAKEWASLPRVVGEDSDMSYYASDGLNVSRVATDELLDAVEKVKPLED